MSDNKDRELSKKHLLLALRDMQEPFPKTHEDFVEYLRDYFVSQKIEVFSRFIAKNGEAEFRELVKEAVLESGKYIEDEDGKVRPVG